MCARADGATAGPHTHIHTQPYTISMVVPGDEVFSAIIAMLLQILILGVLSLYLSLVLPSEFGIQRPWHFPITDLIKLVKRWRFGDVADNAETALTTDAEAAEMLDHVRTPLTRTAHTHPYTHVHAQGHLHAPREREREAHTRTRLGYPTHTLLPRPRLANVSGDGRCRLMTWT
jgi:hypothetical protein